MRYSFSLPVCQKYLSETCFDVCVVGAGVAGVVFASELISSNPKISVLLIEQGAGGAERNNNIPTDVASRGIPIKSWSRVFALGGASKAWGGVSAALDPKEMQGHDFFHCSGWPIDFDELSPYYEKVRNKFGFPTDSTVPLIPPPVFSTLTTREFACKVLPADFESFIPEEVVTVTDAHVSQLACENASQNANCITVNSVVEPETAVKVYARSFVITSGTIESLKLILNSCNDKAIELGESFNVLGRFFMNHPKANIATIKLPDNHPDLGPLVGVGQLEEFRYVGLSLSKEQQEDQGLLNSYFKLVPIYEWNEDDALRDGIQRIRNIPFLVNLFLKLRFKKTFSILDAAEIGEKNEKVQRAPINGFKTILLGLKYLWYRLTGLQAPVRKYEVRIFLEMMPNFENYVSLIDDLDSFSKKNAFVKNNFSDVDKRTVEALLDQIRLYVERNLGGKFALNQQMVTASGDINWNSFSDASHHLGGAIMGYNLDESVVNSNLQVHALPNVYLCSGAVFPTSGSANPTWTIAALASRLSDHFVKNVCYEEDAREGY
jgi:choline dehydrogenase-like flavoprotein